MRSMLVGWLIAVCLLTAPSILMAQAASEQKTPGSQESSVDLEHLRFDHEKLEAMSWEERRVYMRSVKEARESYFLANGSSKSSAGYVPLETPRRVEEQPRLRVPGTNITYDSGTVTGMAGQNSQTLGNRFDSALNPAGTMCCFPVETSGSITMITFDMVNTFFGSAVFSIYSNIMGTTANLVTSQARPGVMTGLNTLSVSSPGTANAYMNGTFVAGIWQFNTTMTAVGVDTGSTGGQGFHAVSLNDNGSGPPGTGTMLTTVTTGGGGGLNVVFRVSGNVATPVELLNFDIE
ncbi:MAG: hypothetical protein AAF560_14070 [Acidobacteriota bacterium]